MVWRMDTAPPPAPGASVIDALSLLAAVTDELLVGSARDTHDAISRRVHGVARLGLGSAADPVESVHRGVAGAIYGGLGLALRKGGAGLDKLAATGVGPRLEEGARGRFVSSAVNGLIGDALLRDRPQLAIPMAVRAAGHDVRPTPTDLDAAFPTATGRLVVFLHGLCENESYWRLHRERTGTTYGEALAEEGWTPVYLRANTGLADPGERRRARRAAARRGRVMAGRRSNRIALVGHSMGGLIMRAALNVLALEGRPRWADRVTDVVTLGAPHRGAPIAWGIGHGQPAARAAARDLAVRPDPRQAVRGRSRPGRRVRRRAAAPEGSALPAGCRDRHRVRPAPGRVDRGRLPGPAPVRRGPRPTRAPSCSRTQRALHVGRTDHFGILNHPEVLSALKRWLA